MTLQVYLPNQCLLSPSGLLLGYQDHQNKKCCVTGILEFTDGCSIGNTLKQICEATTISSRSHVNAQSVSVIGVWNNRTQTESGLDSYDIIKYGQTCHFLEVLKLVSQLPEIRPIGLWKSEREVSSAITFLYDANVISQSYFLTDAESQVDKVGRPDATHLQFLGSSVRLANSGNLDSRLKSNLRLNNFVQKKPAVKFLGVRTSLFSVLSFVCHVFGLVSYCR